MYQNFEVGQSGSILSATSIFPSSQIFDFRDLQIDILKFFS